MTSYLSLEDLLYIVERAALGPVRDMGLLDSAAHRPQTNLFGVEAYPDVDLKAAALLESIVRNHALVDGNKRLGWLAVFAFYARNGILLDAPEDPAYDMVIGVATGELALASVAEQLALWH